jgi:putative transposase
VVLYRRNRIAGGTYFFTITLKNRASTLLVDHIDGLLHAIRAAKRARPFRIDALVILPEHLHAIWTLPIGDHDYSGRWRAIKARFSKSIAKSGVDLHRNAKGEYDLWQRRFWEHTIRDDTDMEWHVDYIHFNPVKHAWVTRVRDWPHSTFHRYVRVGTYSLDWAGASTEPEGGVYGE